MPLQAFEDGLNQGISLDDIVVGTDNASDAPVYPPLGSALPSNNNNNGPGLIEAYQHYLRTMAAAQNQAQIAPTQAAQSRSAPTLSGHQRKPFSLILVSHTLPLAPSIMRILIGTS
jgi:hypothetical protein